MALNITEYAQSMGISTQSVYNSIKRYKKELEGHIRDGKNHKNQKTQILDDYAVDFLNQHRDKRLNTSKATAENTNKNYLLLREQVSTLQNALLESQNLYIQEQQTHLEDVKQLNEQIKDLQNKIIELQTPKEEQPPQKKGFFSRLFSWLLTRKEQTHNEQWQRKRI